VPGATHGPQLRPRGVFGLRFLVALAEAPSSPGNAGIVSAWSPTKERGTAAAIFNSAQYFATVLFAPLMGFIVFRFGLPHVFCVADLVGGSVGRPEAETRHGAVVPGLKADLLVALGEAERRYRTASRRSLCCFSMSDRGGKNVQIDRGGCVGGAVPAAVGAGDSPSSASQRPGQPPVTANVILGDAQR
jgi:MFS family permease